jgi:hypothetical protein
MKSAVMGIVLVINVKDFVPKEGKNVIMLNVVLDYLVMKKHKNAAKPIFR